MDIPRGIPAPLDGTANERAHRLDAEEEAFMTAHAAGIIEAWDRTGDPSTYPAWNEARQQWPGLWSRWRALVQARDAMNRLIDNARR
jgi:hypothetical protein